MVLRQKRLGTFFPTSPGGQLPTAELHRTNTKELTEVTSYKSASSSLCSWGGALKFLPCAPHPPKTTLPAESDHLVSLQSGHSQITTRLNLSHSDLTVFKELLFQSATIFKL